nr:hypothetical protein [Tanacetum cinerariifolium]
MGRDTIQLENAVSTISQEYLLEFTSEYGIPESLHPELPGPEDHIVEFRKVGVYTKFFEFANFRIRFLVFTSWDLAYGKIGEAANQAFGLLKANSVPSGLVSISPAPDPSTHDDPYVNSVHDSCGVSITDASGGVSSSFSTRKSARILYFTDFRGRYVILCSPSMMLYFCNRPATSGRDITCLMGWSVMTTMGYVWKYLRSLLAAQTSARTSFSIGV